MTPSGIEPTTCRFVAQSLNHYATAYLQFIYINGGIVSLAVVTMLRQIKITSYDVFRFLWHSYFNIPPLLTGLPCCHYCLLGVPVPAIKITFWCFVWGVGIAYLVY